MAAPEVGPLSLLPEAELARLARVLARYLSGRQLTAASTGVAGRRAGQGLDFLDFRDYRPGDELRSIDWRASARSREMQVRRYSGDVSSDWYLCVDASASMAYADGGKWLLARQLAAAFAYVLLHLGHRVALLLYSTGVDAMCPPGRGHGQYTRILATVSQSGVREHGGRSDLGSCLDLLGRSDPVLVVSDFLAPDAMLSGLDRLVAQRRELHLLQLTQGADLAIPDGPDLLLQDVETGHTVPCADPVRARQLAAARAAMLSAELAQWSRRYRVPYTSCAEHEHWRDILLRHFMRG